LEEKYTTVVRMTTGDKVWTIPCSYWPVAHSMEGTCNIVFENRKGLGLLAWIGMKALYCCIAVLLYCWPRDISRLLVDNCWSAWRMRGRALTEQSQVSFYCMRNHGILLSVLLTFTTA
jgi:hypothetical protein